MPSRRNQKIRQEIARQTEDVQRHLSLSYSRSEGFLSPLPSAHELAQMNNVVPNGAERVLGMLEKQSEHRMEIEKKAIYGDTIRANLGLFAGFIVTIAMLALSYQLIAKGHETAGTIFGTIDIVALAGVFIYGTVQRKNERTAKAEIRNRALEQRQH